MRNGVIIAAAVSIVLILTLLVSPSLATNGYMDPTAADGLPREAVNQTRIQELKAQDQNITTPTLEVSGSPGTPKIPPFLANPSPGTPPDETGSASGSETYVFVTKWGLEGSGDVQFNVPYGVAVDSSGNVYVADKGNNRIQKFSSDGSFLSKWGSYGSGDGQFIIPEGIAVDPSGNVYVVDELFGWIQKFNSTGTFLTKWRGAEFPSQATILLGVATDSSGNIYVADQDYPNSRILKFTSNGTFLAKWGSYGTGDGQFSGPYGVAVDSSGNVFVTEVNTIYGKLDNYRIQKFNSDGIFMVMWGSNGSGDGQFESPCGVAVDSSGNVFVADTGNNRIQKFAPFSANPPVAGFTGTPTSGTAPLTVQFTDSSTGSPTSWNWDFGDVSSVNATQRNPVHTYVSNGTYTVSLNATNSAGSNTFTRTNYITVGSGQGQYIFTEQQNGATVYLNPTNTITLKLKDNPSTGYSWNLATTDGLKVTSESFLSSDTTGMLNGAGGIHFWNMTVVGTGEQKISGIYSRSWEPVTGNENRFDMTIVVV